MNRNLNIFLIVFLSAFVFNVNAHQNSVELYESTNLKTFVTWGYENAIFQKAELFSLMSQELIDKLEFDNQVIINLIGSLTGETKYSARVGHNQENRYNRIAFPIIENDKNAIVITILTSGFSIENSLKILEHAIINYDELKKSQRKLEPYSLRDETPLDSILVNEIVSEKKSNIVDSVIISPIHVEIGFKNFFLKGGKYCFKSRQVDEDDPIQLELDDVY